MDEDEIKKQSIGYRPELQYVEDYQTEAPVEQSDISYTGRNKQPLDLESIPSIGSDIEYLDRALIAIPSELASAIHEIYDPVKEIYFNTLIDKIIDPNPQKPDQIIKKPDDGNDDDDEDDVKKVPSTPVYPIVLRPVKPGEEPPTDDDSGGDDKDKCYPIILLPVQKKSGGGDDDGGGDDGDIDDLPPIVLLPIVDKGDNGSNGTPGGGDDDSEIDDEDGLWDPPSWEVEYLYPDLEESLDKEFNYVLTKVVKHYMNTLKDILNNYFFNVLRLNTNETKENKTFIVNSLKITSNDIVNHSKHLLDISIKDENMAAFKTEFLSNNFNIRGTTTHIQSFYVSNEFRKRYTKINYSIGKSRVNSTSDQLLKGVNAQYELQFRSSFENLFRYLDSSLIITRDIFGLHIQNTLSKQTIVKKGGRR